MALLLLLRQQLTPGTGHALAVFVVAGASVTIAKCVLSISAVQAATRAKISATVVVGHTGAIRSAS